jgi:hypothetical protein
MIRRPLRSTSSPRYGIVRFKDVTPKSSAIHTSTAETFLDIVEVVRKKYAASPKLYRPCFAQAKYFCEKRRRTGFKRYWRRVSGIKIPNSEKIPPPLDGSARHFDAKM